MVPLGYGAIKHSEAILVSSFESVNLEEKCQPYFDSTAINSTFMPTKEVNRPTSMLPKAETMQNFGCHPFDYQLIMAFERTI
jgi:hypothetical protein